MCEINDITKKDCKIDIIDFSDKNLTLLPNIPSNLIVINLDCSINKLTELPEILSVKVKILNCSYNKLTELPRKLPLLSLLYCSHNELIKLPSFRCLKLDEIDCSYNKLIELPLLPSSIYLIDFSYNNIIYISDANIKKLNLIDELLCSNNPFLNGYDDIYDYINKQLEFIKSNKIRYIEVIV